MSARHILTPDEFRDLIRTYDQYPRKKPVYDIALGRLVVDIPDAASFISQVRDIFRDQQYALDINASEPVILDIGANIGMASLFFAEKFPNSQITSYEADPFIFEFFRRNLIKNNVANVKALNVAVWDIATELSFNSTGTDAGHISLDEGTVVQAIDFNKELAKFHHIDLLKMDIEGSENVVFPHIEEHLQKVDNIILEYHTEPSAEQQLSAILAIMERQGFRYHLHHVNKRPSPLLNKSPSGYFDCQVNIFAYRRGN